MSPSKRLKPVQQVARNREQKAARSMGDSHRQLQQQEIRLQQLKVYHQEYLERFERASRQGISASHMQEYRAFLARLDQAIQEQVSLVAASRQDHSSKRETWKQKHTRSQALDKVVERYQREERRCAEQTEQKESDDRSQRRPPDEV